MKKSVRFFLAVCFMAMIPYGGPAQGANDLPSKEDPNKPYGEGSHALVEVPPGMELVSIGGIRMIIPQGTKVEKKGSLLTMEGPDEYAARNFKEMNDRFQKMEAGQNDLRKSVDDLKREIADLRKK